MTGCPKMDADGGCQPLLTIEENGKARTTLYVYVMYACLYFVREGVRNVRFGRERGREGGRRDLNLLYLPSPCPSLNRCAHPESAIASFPVKPIHPKHRRILSSPPVQHPPRHLARHAEHPSLRLCMLPPAVPRQAVHLQGKKLEILNPHKRVA